MDGPFWVDLRAPHMNADAPSVTLSTTNLALVPVANLPVLGSNYFGYVGKAIRMRAYGRITTGATPGNGQLSFYWGTGAAANGTILAQSATFALTASQTNLTWNFEFFCRCRAIGATGTLMSVGEFNANPGVVASTLQPILVPPSAPAAVGVDLTQNFVISPQFLRSGSTAETITVHEFTWESLN